ncbi:ATP-binding protein [Microterricola viridarii]|uniref:Helicase HerA central domain-containing protein n=1 Tax=Microterricola viridarii TaxID=412690 RepID=A0A1H1SRC0_9MICO|nr:ATP-binding protein [Microterricola viridarii]SDS50286.1 hypothetical protein SAMN04489834_1600 [Microterricola viridarii]
MKSSQVELPAADTSYALSLDGRRFTFGAVVSGAADHGQFVTLLSPDGRRQLGQVDAVTAEPGGTVSGEGALLGAIGESGLDARGTFPFGSAEVVTAEPSMIELVYATAGATLNVGSVLGADAVTARLIPQRFNRHTFWCGQSGSGKSYALGVLIEQLLVRTRLPMVIFDPNADFVRLGELSAHGEEAESAEEAALLQSRDIRVLRPAGDSADPLLVRFTELSMPSKAAVLRLDPLADRAEYNELLHFERTIGSRSPEEIIPRLLRSESPAARTLAARIDNLRLIDWELWAGDRPAVTDIIRERPDATVLDLGGFNHPDEYLVVALAVLDELWERREERRPILIVIDEAHNLCSPENDGPLEVAVRERITQIAAEGRKFGLWLLLSTQRPSKVASGILSQCDNVAVMRMSSPADLTELAVRFGFAPAAMLARTTGFRQGEAFFAGGFVPAPTLASMRTRLTVEGGVDVRVPLRAEGARPR